MGLGIAKSTPKYTPPKVCKKTQGTTVTLYDWAFGNCPPWRFGTVQAWLPPEPGGLIRPALFLIICKQDNADHCHYVGTVNDHGGRLDVDILFDFIAQSTAMNLFFNLNFVNYGYGAGYDGIAHVMQPIPWTQYPPSAGPPATGTASARFTFL